MDLILEPIEVDVLVSLEAARASGRHMVPHAELPSSLRGEWADESVTHALNTLRKLELVRFVTPYRRRLPGKKHITTSLRPEGCHVQLSALGLQHARALASGKSQISALSNDEQNILEQLGSRGIDILIAMLELNATTFPNKRTKSEIASAAFGQSYDANNLGKVMSQLNDLNLIFSNKTSTVGGSWLSEIGIRLAYHCRPAKNSDS